MCVDDQQSFRRVLRSLVAATPGFTNVGEASCGEEAIRTATALRPDLVLMDVGMPGMSGFDAAAILAEQRRGVVVVLMSASPVEPPPSYGPRGGEVGFVLKEELCPRRLLDVWHARRTRGR